MTHSRTCPRKAVHLFSSFRFVALGVLALALVGCSLRGTEPESDTVDTVSGRQIEGKVMGGPIPIVGAHVILWQTMSNGYPSSSNHVTGTNGSRTGATSVQLATATSGSLGSFSFTAGSYTCDSNQFVYITATGGNTGAGVNNQSTQVAALGSCSHFDNTTDQGNVKIYMGEVSTVAAAYALGNFMYVDDNGGTGNQLVYIGAPSTNNSTSGSCTSSAFGSPTNNIQAGTGVNNASNAQYTATCTSAGLAHAFANAANLVNAVTYTSGNSPTGQAYATSPTNTSATVPQALINTIANSLEACTNTASISGSTPSAACSTLFGYTTPAQPTNGAALTAPANEIQGVLNLAKNPTANGHVTDIYNFSTPQASTFMPALSAAPTDYSLAIVYTSTVNGATTASLGYPLFTALDYNDNAYVLYSSASTPIDGGLAGLTSSGGYIFNQAPNALYCNPEQIATDTIGNIFLTNDVAANTTCSSPATTTPFVAAFSSSTGTAISTTTFPASLSQPNAYGVAVDQFNDVWFSRDTTGAAPVRLILYSSGGSTGGSYALNGNVLQNTSTYPSRSVAIDANQNIWFTQINSTPGDTTANVVANAGTAALPYYGLLSSFAPVFDTATLPAIGGSSLAIDGSGNAWAPTASALSKVTSTLTTGNATYNCNGTTSATCTGAKETIGTSGVATLTTTTTYTGLNTNNLPNVVQVTDTATPQTAPYFNNTIIVGNNGNTSTAAFKGTIYSQYNTGTSTGNKTDTFTLTVPPAIVSISDSSNVSTSAPSPGVTEFDGAGADWFTNNPGTGTGSIYYYQPANSSPAAVGIAPCYLPAAATTCVSSPYTNPDGLAIDSTGSLWVSVASISNGTSTIGGGLLQVLGSANPTQPQLSYGHPASKP